MIPTRAFRRCWPGRRDCSSALRTASTSDGTRSSMRCLPRRFVLHPRCARVAAGAATMAVPCRSRRRRVPALGSPTRARRALPHPRTRVARARRARARGLAADRAAGHPVTSSPSTARRGSCFSSPGTFLVVQRCDAACFARWPSYWSTAPLGSRCSSQSRPSTTRTAEGSSCSRCRLPRQRGVSCWAGGGSPGGWCPWPP